MLFRWFYLHYEKQLFNGIVSYVQGKRKKRKRDNKPDSKPEGKRPFFLIAFIWFVSSPTGMSINNCRNSKGNILRYYIIYYLPFSAWIPSSLTLTNFSPCLYTSTSSL